MNRKSLLLETFILVLCQIKKAIADTCDFYQGSTSVSRSCSTGCCENECCTNKYEKLAIILGVVFGCLLFIIIITVLVVCLTRNRWSKKITPKKDQPVSMVRERKRSNIELGKITRIKQ